MRPNILGALVGVLCLVASGVATADDGAVDLQFFSGIPGAQHEPRFTSKPVTVALKVVKSPRGLQGIEHLGGRIKLGPKPGKGRPFVLARSRAGMVFDLLLIDVNDNGKLEDEMPAKFELVQSGGKNHSEFEIRARVNHGSKVVENYLLSLRVTAASNVDVPDQLAYMCGGYKSCRVMIGGEGHFVVVSDAQSDAVYGKDDHWTIRPASSPEAYELSDARTVGDYVWAGGKAWKLELKGTSGKEGRLVLFDPGISEEEDRQKRNPVVADSDESLDEEKTPLEFVQDYPKGRAEARQKQAALFLSFEASGCTECQAMRGKVYGNTEIASAANGLVCVQLEAADPLAHKHAIEEHPAGILFDPDGEEIGRFEGVQTVNVFLAFLANAHSYLLPSDHEPAKLKGSAKKRHAKVVKAAFKYLEDNKGHGLLVDRISELGTRKNRSARDALIRFAEKRKSQEYIAAAFFAIAKISGKRSIEFLCGKKALASGDFLVAQKAAEALGVAKDPRAIRPITDVMTHKSTKIEIVHACAIALAQCGPEDRGVMNVIFEYTGNRKDTIRSGAVEALGYLRFETAIAKLQDFLKNDKNTRVRAHAAWGIGHTMRTELIPLLREAIKDDKAHTVRTAALEAIREIQGEKRQ